MNGPLSVSRSCVPMATNVRWRARFWCSLSCSAMKDSYRSWVNLIFRKTAPETYGRIPDVCGRLQYGVNSRVAHGRHTCSCTVMLWSSPSGGATRRYCGDGFLPRKMLSMREMPSKHSMSYLVPLITSCTSSERCAMLTDSRVSQS